MATTKKTLSLYLEEETLRDFEKLAEACHLDKNSFGALLISRFADLKLEHGLDALTSIPKEYFKARAGRSSARKEGASRELATAAHA